MEKLITAEVRQKLEGMETVEALIEWLKDALMARTGQFMREKMKTGKKAVGFLCAVASRNT